jgi:hypothetical protein
LKALPSPASPREYPNPQDPGFLSTTTTPNIAPTLYRIDPFTGVATAIGQTDLKLSASFEVRGKFCAFRAVLDGFYGFPITHAELVTLDLATGHTNKLTNLDPSTGVIFGAAPIESPL